MRVYKISAPNSYVVANKKIFFLGKLGCILTGKESSDRFALPHSPLLIEKKKEKKIHIAFRNYGYVTDRCACPEVTILQMLPVTM